MKRVKGIWSFHRAGLFILILSSVLLFAGCSNKQLATVPNDSEANEIINVLHENGIDAVKEDVLENNVKQYRITISSDLFSGDDEYMSAIQVLHDNCLPLHDPPPIESGGYMASVEVERAKIQRQLKINIIRQLRQLPGVTCVDVIFVEPQREISIDPYPASASVVINFKNQEAGFTEQDVKSLVAGSVPKLDPAKVSVKPIYNPVRPVQKSNQTNVRRLMLIGGAGLFIILGSVFLVYFLRKRRGASTALTVQPEEFEEVETIE